VKKRLYKADVLKAIRHYGTMMKTQALIMTLSIASSQNQSTDHSRDAEECWQEVLKHQPFGWVKLKDTESGYYLLKGIASQVVIGFNENPFSYKKVFEDYTFANGTPFGAKIEEE
jgi:hypothetical protein